MWAGRMILAAFCVVAFGSVTMAGRKAKSETTNTVTTADGTGNLSKQRRDELVKKLRAIRSFLETSTNTNAVRLLQYAAELEKEVRTKKYGLVFEEHKERVDVELEHNLPVLTENKKRFIDNGGEVNFLIEGDNLAALKLLEKAHRGRIDLIYIDPPYNTGNEDFVYNDSYVDATDTFRHSKWLSFMKKRLEIARRLLTDEGSIFISIDDNEYAALKMLCDSIFGESCFVNTIAVKMSEVSGVKMSHVSSPRLRLSLCWWGEEWQDEGLVKRASAADFVNVGGLLTEGEVSRDGRGRTVEEAVPEGAARSAEADSTVRPRPKFFPPSSDLGLTRPSPFPRGTRRASCSRAFRAACGCCISRSRASPPQSPRPSCGSSSRGNIRP